MASLPIALCSCASEHQQARGVHWDLGFCGLRYQELLLISLAAGFPWLALNA
jgi:hypothetical protein